MYTFKELSEKVSQFFATEHFTGSPKNLYDPIDYTLADGGKRIRPILLLAATDLFGGDIETARYAAIGIETFHNFTLLHDDLMDQSPLRRGKPTVYRKWSPNTAILSGDAMNILAWRYFLKTPHPRLHEILCIFEKTSMEICEGQQYDMDFEQRNDVSIDEYMEMIRLKTAVLLGCALQIGAIYANANQHDIDLIYNFGIQMGLAFQLRDDLLDAYGDVSTFGKQTGTDIADNKKTYLLLRALQKAHNAQRSRLQELFSQHPTPYTLHPTPYTLHPTPKIQEVLAIYDQLEIRHDVEQEIAILTNKALASLDQISVQNERKNTLLEIANKLLDRKI